MSGASLEECHTTSVRILNEEPSAGLTAPVYSRTANKGRTIPSDWMFSSRCQWRLQWRDCCTVASNIMKNFHSAPNCWFPSCCVCVNAFCIFHSWRFSCPCRNTSETTHTADVLRRSRQAIIFPVITTLLTFRRHVSFAPPHPSCQSISRAVLIICDASFLP